MCGKKNLSIIMSKEQRNRLWLFLMGGGDGDSRLFQENGDDGKFNHYLKGRKIGKKWSFLGNEVEYSEISELLGNSYSFYASMFVQ